MFFLIKNVPLIVQRAWLGGEEGNDKNKGCIKTCFSWISKSINVLITFLEQIEVIYYIAYGVLSVLGTFFHPFFFVFHLSVILLRYPTLKAVTNSIYYPRK